MDFREAMRSVGGSLRNHPIAVIAVAGAIAGIVLGVLFTVLWFAHVEREHRQTWIETRFEQRLDLNNEVLAAVENQLDSFDSRSEHTDALIRENRDALTALREETRQLRIAVLEEMKRP